MLTVNVLFFFLGVTNKVCEVIVTFAVSGFFCVAIKVVFCLIFHKNPNVQQCWLSFFCLFALVVFFLCVAKKDTLMCHREVKMTVSD